MEIVLIRHAQPRWSVDGLADNDPDLTDLGKTQAACLAELAADWAPPDALWTSTMRRSIATAQPLADVTARHVQSFSWLDEIRPPEHWHGSPVELVESRFAASRDRHPGEWWDGIDDGESVRHFHDRVWTGTEAALHDFGIRRSDQHLQLWDIDEPGSRLTVVAHAGTNALLLGLLLGLEVVPWEWDRFALAHTAVAKVETVPVGGSYSFSLRLFGDTSHLPADAVTW